MTKRLLAVAMALMLAACAAGPDFQRPAAPTPSGYLAAEPRAGDQRFLSGADIPAQWWELFHSPQLNALVEKALAANPNLQAMEAALRAAQESTAAQRGAFWPQVGVSLSPSRSRIADSLSSPLNAPANPYSLHTAQVTVAYTLDVFGGNRRQVESLEAQAESARLQLEAARLSLAANVASAAIQEATLRGQLAATERTVKLAEELLALTRKQKDLGAAAEAAVAAQEAGLAQAKAALPPLRKQLGQTRHLLIALTGGLPDKELAERFDLATLELPRELPLSLPSKLVEQRPDVRAAEAQAHAAAAQVGVALAARLPQFSLSAGMGSVAGTLGTLFQGGGGFWSVAGAIAQPVFQGGTLVHRQGAAQAAYDQALAQYRATVISAFQNVADTLTALDQDAQAQDAAAAAEQAAGRSLALARRQVELGDISRYDILGVEQSYQQARMALVQAKANRYLDSAALFQSLGGGWWNRGWWSSPIQP